MKIIVTYNSKTGFTKRYAEWIAEELGCEMMPSKKFSHAEDYDVVIHGGWLMAGMVTGLENIRKLNPKKLVVFAVGFTSEEAYVETVKETNKLNDTPVFYFLGGTHPKKMNFMMRAVIKAVTKKPVEEIDWSDKKFIQPLVQCVKEMEGR